VRVQRVGTLFCGSVRGQSGGWGAAGQRGLRRGRRWRRKHGRRAGGQRAAAGRRNSAGRASPDPWISVEKARPQEADTWAPGALHPSETGKPRPASQPATHLRVAVGVPLVLAAQGVPVVQPAVRHAGAGPPWGIASIERQPPRLLAGAPCQQRSAREALRERGTTVQLHARLACSRKLPPDTLTGARYESLSPLRRRSPHARVIGRDEQLAGVCGQEGEPRDLLAP
jgi:hypothetical protein